MNRIQMQTVINNHESKIEQLKMNAASIEVAVRDICLELESHGYGDSDNLEAYKELMNSIINQ